MPYIHSDLGVPCMTVSEFWAAEAKIENKPVDEVIGDYYSELADDMERARQEVLKDYEGALKLLQDYYDPVYGDFTYLPMEVISIVDADVRYSVRSSTTSFTAVVKCDDGSIRKLAYTETQYAGSYMDPPDVDVNCMEVE